MTLVGERLAEGIGPEDLLPGEISEGETRRARTLSGLNYLERHVSVGDISTPEGRRSLRERLDLLDYKLKENSHWPIPDYAEGISNPVSDDFYQTHLKGTTMQYWRDYHMPQAPALYILQRPYDRRLFPGNTIDSYAEDIFINAPDSIAIRARGAIYHSIIMKYISGSDEDEYEGLALGAGAGVPNINATLEARDVYEKKIRWQERDLSQNSVDLNIFFFKDAGIPEEDIDARRGDLSKAYALPDESVHMIDMLGLWEYLDRKRCVKALQEFYRILKPGGVIVVSNMLENRPQLDLNQRAIGWKGVKPRSVDELIEIAHEAGLPTEDIRITLSEDGIYAVMEIHK